MRVTHAISTLLFASLLGSFQAVHAGPVPAVTHLIPRDYSAEYKSGTGVQCEQDDHDFPCTTARNTCLTLDDTNFNFGKMQSYTPLRQDKSSHVQFVAVRVNGSGKTFGSQKKNCLAMVDKCCTNGVTMHGAGVSWDGGSTAKGGYVLNADFSG